MVGKTMDIQYFLEMVDLKHRHGSNLRKYHEYWKTTDSNDNFFHWLDHGAGKDVELPACGREQLEREQVRYLSRAERLKYLVKIGSDGKFRWAKNNELIWTNNTRYRDSATGIVPADSKDTADSGMLIPTSRASLDEKKSDRGPVSTNRVKDFFHSRRRSVQHVQEKLFPSDDSWIFVCSRTECIALGRLMVDRSRIPHIACISASRNEDTSSTLLSYGAAVSGPLD